MPRVHLGLSLSAEQFLIIALAVAIVLVAAGFAAGVYFAGNWRPRRP